MKKALSFLMALILIISLAVSGSFAATSAKLNSSAVLVNGKSVSFEAYTIGSNNYFKLRDLAFALNGTQKQFNVGWEDGANNAIIVTTGIAYTSVGGELTSSGKTGIQSASISTSKVFINGTQANITAYLIGNNNYFMLRDVGAAINFGVGWDGSANTITINTSVGYTADVTPSPTPSQISQANMKVNISCTCSNYNHVGNEWGQGFTINGQDISSGQTIKVNLNDTLQISSTVEEYDKIPDIGSASSNVTISADNLKNGFTVQQSVNVRENRGQYSGNIATWNVTYKFTPN
jgi:hypothetical protein